MKRRLLIIAAFTLGWAVAAYAGLSYTARRPSVIAGWVA